MDSAFIFKTGTWLLLLELTISVTIELSQEDNLKRSIVPRASANLWCSDELITNPRGIITSPEYPNNYPNHISCTWHILAGIGEVITVTFQDLDIEESGSCSELPCCIYNWVKIGPSLNGTEKQYCGQSGSLLPTYVSSFSKVWIKFHVSSVRTGGRGFKLHYTVGSRERNLCRNDEFKCNVSQCIPLALRCNGYPDCNDGSDELSCSGLCDSGRSCRTSSLCYGKHQRCDGVFDCPDFSDEMGCDPCSENDTHCYGQSDQCYNPVIQRCNRIMDCLNGEDEKDCLHACPHKIICASGIGCYSTEERCDGIAQCSDSSDEKLCLPELCNYDRGGFLCDNSRCIREIWKCDHTDDCGDGTDEANCLRNSVLTAAVMGSLICALLLVVAVSCTCRLYSLRALENQMSNRENTLNRLNQEYLFREPPPSYAVAVGEHCRNLCVENIHYNSCPRRGRRRPRRARRMHESRRSSLPTTDSGRNQNPLQQQPFSFLFPGSTTMPNLMEGSVTMQCQNGNGSSETRNEMDRGQGCLQNQTVDEPTPTSDPPGGDNQPKPLERNSNSNDAESSFSEMTFPLKVSEKEASEHIAQHPIAGVHDNSNGENSSFQSENSTEIEDYPESSSPDFHIEEQHCDIDMQPLIS